MKTRILSFMASAVAVVALLTGCSTENDFENSKNGFASLELSSVSSSDMLTRAAIDGTTFPQEGEIGLFLFGDEMATKAYGTGYENVKYSYNSTKGKWTASPSIKVGSEMGYLYGYYPYSTTATDVKAIPVASSLNGDDVMYASKQTVTDATASQTSITMNHALARVSIKVVNNGYTGDAKLTKIKLSEAEIAPTGTLNALDGSITATKSDVTLDVPTADQTITATGSTYECLLVPSNEISSRQTVNLTLTIDGEDKTATLSGDNGVIIARGTKSNITITLSNSGISVQTVSVDDWNVVEVGGYKVTVKLSETDEGIAEDVMTNVKIDGSNVIIKASSLQGKRLVCNVGDKANCEGTATNGTHTFTISNISSDIDAVLGYDSKIMLTVSSDSNGKVWIGDNQSKTSDLFESGQEVVIHATPNNGYKLFRWNDNNRETSRTITVGDTDATYSAEFILTDLIPGLFTVNSNGKQVFFSKGNLYCSGVTFYDDNTKDNYGAVKSMAAATWGFEANQYDTNPTTDQSRDPNHISHFIWWSTAEKAMALKYESSWDGESPFFAEKNFTVNGYSGWSVLTGGKVGEWKYLLETRTMKYSKPRYTTVFGVSIEGVTCNGLFIYPDDYNGNEIGSGGPDTWADINAAGIVFLPAAGFRNGDSDYPYPANADSVGNKGFYWSASTYGSDLAYGLYFFNGNVYPSSNFNRYQAHSVRLVTEYE